VDGDLHIPHSGASAHHSPDGYFGREVWEDGVTIISPANLKRLFLILIVAAVVAIMTGTPGSSTASPTTGVHGSFMERVSWFGLFAAPRWLLFLTLGVIVWLLVSLYRPRARTIRQGIDHVLAFPERAVEQEADARDVDRDRLGRRHSPTEIRSRVVLDVPHC